MRDTMSHNAAFATATKRTRGSNNLAPTAKCQTREGSVFLPFLITLVFLSVIGGIAVDSNGEGISWTLLAIAISPLLAVVIVLACIGAANTPLSR